MTIYILIISLVLILALVAMRLANDLKIPQLLLFMLLGVSFNFFGADFTNYAFSNQVASLALMFIIFYGGFGTKWKMSKPVAKEAIILSFLGTISTALITGFFVYFVFDFSLLEALLLGSIVGSTDYASVSDVLVSRHLKLKYNTDSLLELESGSNDPTAYTMVVLFVTLLQGQRVNVSILILLQVGLGLALGFVLGWLFIRLLDYLKSNEGMEVILLAAAALFTYEFTNQMGGNGYLAVYIFGIYIGNKEFIGKREVVFFFDSFTNLAQIGLFFLLGLLSDPGSIFAMMPTAFVIMLFMTIIARPASVYGLMLPFKMKKNQLAVIAFAGLRGAAAIAFAISVVNSDTPNMNDLYHIVFDICLLSSLIQGGLLPVLSKKSDMVDPEDASLRNFNSLQDKSDMGFLATKIKADSDLADAYIRDINLAFDFIIAKILRQGETIVPKGNVQLKVGDIVVMAGRSYFDVVGTDLLEFRINDYNSWVNKEIKNIHLDHEFLIVLVLRDDNDLIVPNGDTKIREGDTVLVLDAKGIEG
ncbi:potassium/proton antiporter [Jeotgalibaca sp. A122]|uniref:potassium/proton antiporter n=1 Tax=Jeotgalibaca sp. A122 TaxID=3457322 RepID=UPI003FD568D6